MGAWVDNLSISEGAQGTGQGRKTNHFMPNTGKIQSFHSISGENSAKCRFFE